MKEKRRKTETMNIQEATEEMRYGYEGGRAATIVMPPYLLNPRINTFEMKTKTVITTTTIRGRTSLKRSGTTATWKEDNNYWRGGGGSF